MAEFMDSNVIKLIFRKKKISLWKNSTQFTWKEEIIITHLCSGDTKITLIIYMMALKKRPAASFVNQPKFHLIPFLLLLIFQRYSDRSKYKRNVNQ